MTHDRLIENLIGLAFAGCVVAAVIVGVGISFVVGCITYIVCQRINREGEVWRDLPVEIEEGVHVVREKYAITSPDGKICGYEYRNKIVDPYRNNP